MKQSDAEWIEKRAYALWEEEGRPHGREASHWQAAQQEYLAIAKGTGKPNVPSRRRVGIAAGTEQVAAKETPPISSPPLTTKTKRSRKE